MLMLGVKPGDYVMIGDDIKIRVVEAGAVFRLGIEAPRDMDILRSSLYEQQNPDYRDEEYTPSTPIPAITPEMKARKKKKAAIVRPTK